MIRSLSIVFALALVVPALLLPAQSRALRPHGCRCSSICTGKIRRRLAVTIAGLDLGEPAPSPPTRRTTSISSRKAATCAGATVVLDSDGGSVLGAIALGREIRRSALDTTVGRADRDARRSDEGEPRAKLSPRADCESMCAFVLLAGVHRIVPPQARVMVHQIWLGDRRDDPTAANYSAEDLVLVQRDIGRLARYTRRYGRLDGTARSGAAHSALGADASAHRARNRAACMSPPKRR